LTKNKIYGKITFMLIIEEIIEFLREFILKNIRKHFFGDIIEVNDSKNITEIIKNPRSRAPGY
jgi:hypothetical protein